MGIHWNREWQGPDSGEGNRQVRTGRNMLPLSDETSDYTGDTYYFNFGRASRDNTIHSFKPRDRERITENEIFLWEVTYPLQTEYNVDAMGVRTYHACTVPYEKRRSCPIVRSEFVESFRIGSCVMWSALAHADALLSSMLKSRFEQYLLVAVSLMHLLSSLEKKNSRWLSLCLKPWWDILCKFQSTDRSHPAVASAFLIQPLHSFYPS